MTMGFDISLNRLDPGHLYIDVDMVATIIPIVDASSLEQTGSIVGSSNTRMKVRGPCLRCGKMADLGQVVFSLLHAEQIWSLPNRKMRCWKCHLEAQPQ